MQSNLTVNDTQLFSVMNWKSVMAGLWALAGSLLDSMQSQRTNPPKTFDVLQTRVDAFVR